MSHEDILGKRLNKLDQQAPKGSRGKLTVFLGAAPGVGKTYTMLETALDRLQDGVTMAVDWVDTHGDPELDNLFQMLLQTESGANRIAIEKIQSMDMDEIKRLDLQLILVDDLPCINHPGSRHIHRYQDVDEFLEAGIDVYVTLNVQHIESLNDIVAQITGTRVQNTVPDYFIEQADRVQIIDIPAEELVKRFREGKVHVEHQDQKELSKFFRVGNINALRELALRFTAGRVDKAMNEYMREHKIEGPWPVAERVMVCVSSSPFSAQLIRAARRLANGLQAELIAVHVGILSRNFDQDRVARNMRLAEELGAKTITIVGDNLVREVLDAARSQNVSTIVVGKPGRSYLKDTWRRSVVDRIIRESGGINVHVIQGDAKKYEPQVQKTVYPTESSAWRHYTAGLVMVIAITIFSILLADHVEQVNVALLYQLPVMMSAYWWGRWPSYFTALCAVAFFDFIFIPPLLTFTVDDIKDFWSFIIFLLVAFIIGGRTEHLRMQTASARQREKSTRALYDFSREIAAVIDPTLIAQGLAKHAAETIGQSIVVMLPDKSGDLSVCAGQNLNGNSMINHPVEISVARWVFEHGRAAGKSTDTSSDASSLFIPLKTYEKTLGVLGIHLDEPYVAPEKNRLIEAWVGLAAIALERVEYAKTAREAALITESDRLRTALFNSVSHELKAPLASIVGSVTTLLGTGGVYSEKARHELLETIGQGACQMERLISNLLDTARLESGMMQLKIDWCDMADIIGTSLHRLGESISLYSLEEVIEPNLPLLRADCVLLEQVVVNLLDNAMKYSAHGSEIVVAAKVEENSILVSVADRGSGIPEEHLQTIFDKFFRVQQPKHVSGTGLGLSICKGIIEAHGGMIWAENRTDGGSVISFRLPASENFAVLPGKAELSYE